MKKNLLINFLLFFVSQFTAQDGPGGVGSTDGTSNLVLWLKQDAGVEEASADAAEANDAVEFWRDQSGYNNHLHQNTLADRPIFNGSALEFRGDARNNTAGEYFNMPAINPQTIIVVLDNVNHLAANSFHGIMSQVHTGSSVYFHIGAGTTVSFDGTVAETGKYSINGSTFSNSEENHGTSSYPSYETILYGEYDSPQSNFVYFGCLDNSGSPRYRGNYDVKEVIVFDNTLTACEKIKIETYLVAKYGISGYEYYTPPSADYVSGVGQIYDGGDAPDVTPGSSGVLEVDNVSFLTTSSDGIGMGSNGVGGTSADVPAGLDFRLGTIWYLDYNSCDGNNGDIKLRFNVSGGDCGISTPTDASNYRLLYTNNPADMVNATVVSGGVVSGDFIEFTTNTTVVGNQYVSFGTTDVTTSELGTVGPADIVDGLTLWLKPDCGVEEAIGDAAEVGDVIYRWKDQSGGGNHAVQTISAEAPTFNGSHAQFRGDSDNNENGEYLQFSPFEGKTIIAVINNATDGSTNKGIHGLMGQSASSNYVDLFISTQVGYQASFDGIKSEEGAIALSGLELSSNAESVGSGDFPDSLTIAIFQYENNQDDFQYLGGFTRDGSTVKYRANYDLHELIVYNRDLTCSERTDIEEYLSNKYGISLAYHKNENIGDNGYTNAITMLEENNPVGVSYYPLYVSNSTFINDCADTLWIADNGAFGQLTSADDADMMGLAGANVNRWAREWYAVKTSNNLSNGNVTLVFDLDNYPYSSGIVPTGSEYRLITSASPWSYASVVSGPVVDGTQNTITFTVSVDEIDGKKFTLATTDETISPLPVELTSFTAIPVQNQVNINWETATEISNNYFEVERSADAENWDVINFTQGAGNSSQAIQYSAIDYAPLSGVSYYRLKQVDFNGEYKYSSIISIDRQSKVTIYPNPTKDYVTIKMEDINPSALELFSVLGKSVLNQTTFTVVSKNELIIHVSELAVGLYQLHLNGATYTINVLR